MSNYDHTHCVQCAGCHPFSEPRDGKLPAAVQWAAALRLSWFDAIVRVLHPETPKRCWYSYYLRPEHQDGSLATLHASKLGNQEGKKTIRGTEGNFGTRQSGIDHNVTWCDIRHNRTIGTSNSAVKPLMLHDFQTEASLDKLHL
jgi:hypothetical protein